jgi:hypothetical protein
MHAMTGYMILAGVQRLWLRSMMAGAWLEFYQWPRVPGAQHDLLHSKEQACNDGKPVPGITAQQSMKT